ncbi:microcephalin isoform X2 [Hippopotamus amphibius kiboko]|uniref:microcephalin isoform X2 n=1 Tax=Hippopotamus amphibius kiboko TaxID=575201 RepID=UPI002591A664|nr:microcephalin isoform X2 [Hippopotamus amphibius kiboko]
MLSAPLRQARGFAAARVPPPLMEAPETLGGPVLNDVVAYVEVWSANGTENYSKTFTNQLVDMGAKVSKTFNKQVTHVVFKDGYQSTWDKARKRGVKLVSVLWVEKCRTAGAHIDESLFPAANPSEHLSSLIKKKRKCMQPKDFIPKTPENDKRLQRKFEKMAKQLQQQKTTLDNDVPVLLFESNGSLVYSPTVKICSGRHSAMERRLQEMKEKRENLSPTSSQMIEKSDDNTVKSLCEASLNLSHDTLCSEDSFADVLHASFGDLCGSSGCGTQERKLGGFLDESNSAVCASSPVLKTSSVCLPASPGSLGQFTPQKSASTLFEGGVHGQADAAGRITPDAKPSPGQAQGVFDEKRDLSATKGPPGGHSRPQSSSAKRQRTWETCSPPLGERLKKRRSRGRSPAPRLWLWGPEKSPRRVSSPAVQALCLEESSYDDYFSPDNLTERHPESLLPGAWPPAGPALLPCRRGLSRRERTSLLESADFSCIGRSPRAAAKTAFHLQKPANCGADVGLSSRASEEMPAAEETPADCPQAEAQRRGDACLGGGASTHVLDGFTPQKGCRGDFTPLEGSSKEMKGWMDVKGTQKEDASSKAVNSSEGEAHSDYKLNFVGDCYVEKSTEEREELPRGHRESVKSGPVKQDVLDGSWESFKDLNKPHEESRKREKGQKLFRQERLSSAGRYQGTLFADQPTMFITPASSPPRAKLGELVELCGGRVTRSPRKASIFIGPRPGKKRAAAMYLSETWILDSITQHKVCAPESHLLLP